LLGAIVQFDDQDPVGLNQSRTVGIVQTRISDGLQPGVAVGNEIAIVVEAGADIAQVVPNPLHAHRTGHTGIQRRTPPQVLGDRGQILVGNFRAVVRPDLVGHGADLVPRDQTTLVVHRPCLDAFLRIRPNVVIQSQIVLDHVRRTRHRLAAGILERIGNQPVYGG